MLNKGDIIAVRVEKTLDAHTEKNLKGYKPIKEMTIPAAQVWKEPELEGALFPIVSQILLLVLRIKVL